MKVRGGSSTRKPVPVLLFRLLKRFQFHVTISFKFCPSAGEAAATTLSSGMASSSSNE